MNYVVLNGKKSNEVKGLLISALPPITKPLIRSEIMEIDGRDGDIITPLGYSAYDKEMAIGLFGDYDVDAAIRYFDSEGTVIFSNEPDKVYRYKIIQQIDFERLLRFRTATVVFHVQPFKHSAVDKPIAVSNQFLTIKDAVISSNGVNIVVDDGRITVRGTPLSATQIYVPISAALPAGRYTLRAYSDGSYPEVCTYRMINGSVSDTFGGDETVLEGESTVYIASTLAQAATYNYLYLTFAPGQKLNFAVTFTLSLNSTSGVQMRNSGNTLSRPTIKLEGGGNITLRINGKKVLAVALGNYRRIAIDAEEMEAYDGDQLRNRLVTGDYADVTMAPGINTLSWTGGVASVEVTNFSRWI